MTERLALSIAVIAANPTATSILLRCLESSQIGSDRKRATCFWRRMAGFTGICRRLNFIATSTNYFEVVFSALGASGCWGTSDLSDTTSLSWFTASWPAPSGAQHLAAPPAVRTDGRLARPRMPDSGVRDSVFGTI